MILEKSETKKKHNYSGDDFQSEKVFVGDINPLKEKEDCEDISNENKQKMQNVIEISSENTFEAEKTVDSQETISKDKRDTKFNANEEPESTCT